MLFKFKGASTKLSYDMFYQNGTGSLGTFMPAVHKEDILMYNVSCDCNLIAQNNIKSRTPKKAVKIIKNAI